MVGMTTPGNPALDNDHVVESGAADAFEDSIDSGAAREQDSHTEESTESSAGSEALDIDNERTQAPETGAADIADEAVGEPDARFGP